MLSTVSECSYCCVEYRCSVCKVRWRCSPRKQILKVNAGQTKRKRAKTRRAKTPLTTLRTTENGRQRPAKVSLGTVLLLPTDNWNDTQNSIHSRWIRTGSCDSNVGIYANLDIQWDCKACVKGPVDPKYHKFKFFIRTEWGILSRIACMRMCCPRN